MPAPPGNGVSESNPGGVQHLTVVAGDVLHREDRDSWCWCLARSEQSEHDICLLSRHSALCQHYRGLVNVPRQVCWWQRCPGDAGQVQVILNTQPSLRASLHGGAFSGQHHHQQVSKGRVCCEHRSLLAHLTPEPARGGLRDVCQQNLGLSTPLSLRE